MRQDGLGQHILDEGEQRTDVHVLNVQRVLAASANVHHAARGVSIRILVWKNVEGESRGLVQAGQSGRLL